MSRSLLGTNIIGNVTKPAPSDGLVAWMAEQADEDPFISSLTVDEIRRGILEKPAGQEARIYVLKVAKFNRGVLRSRSARITLRPCGRFH